MQKNQVFRVTLAEMNEIKKELVKDETLFIGEMDGENIQSWKEYIAVVSQLFHFPYEKHYAHAGYLDWMEDLDWLNKEGYVFIIYQYSEFLQHDRENEKLYFLNDFINDILPFWEEEVERVMVGGKAKRFSLYLVD